MQRVYKFPKVCTLTCGFLARAAACRFCASGVMAGIRPSGGSTISAVRRFGLLGLCQAFSVTHGDPLFTRLHARSLVRPGEASHILEVQRFFSIPKVQTCTVRKPNQL